MSANKNIEKSFEEIFRTHFSQLVYFAQKYISDFDTCREIVHSIFISVWEKRHDFDFSKPAKSYLFTSVYNRCMNHLRDQKKFADNDGAMEQLEMGEAENTQIEAAELESRIWQVIDSLPEKCREIFVLNRFEEKKYAEIASELNISVKTVETQMSKALKVLREKLKDYLIILWIILLKLLS